MLHTFLSILLPNTRNGTSFRSLEDNSADSSLFDSSSLFVSATSTKNTIPSTLIK